MGVILLTYGDINYFRSQRMAKKAALANGVDKVIMRDDKWLRKTQFYSQNKEILDRHRGAGYWLWKPYIILEELKKLKEEDVLFYQDSGAELTDNIKPLVNIVKEKKIMLFRSHSFTNSGWTKRDCFHFMNCDTEKYYGGPQVWAGFLALKKTSQTMAFITEWLTYATSKHILTDDDNICCLSNRPDFVEHRHDQAVLSLLAIKHNIEIFRDPSQFGDLSREPIDNESGEAYHHNSPYPTLIDLHRGKYPMQFAYMVQYYYFHKQYTKLARCIAARFYNYLKSK